MKNFPPELAVVIIIIMSALPIAYLSEWQMIVCRKYQHTIWPAQVQSHFQGPQHRMKIKEAPPIAGRRNHGPIQFNIPLNYRSPFESIVPSVFCLCIPMVYYVKWNRNDVNTFVAMNTA